MTGNPLAVGHTTTRTNFNVSGVHQSCKPCTRLSVALGLILLVAAGMKLFSFWAAPPGPVVRCLLAPRTHCAVREFLRARL
jgi:hypothetical protein